MDPFERTRMLFGAEAMEKLARSRVAVFGLGLERVIWELVQPILA